MGISEKLRDIRRERDLSQEQLAELLGVSQQSISKWEQEDDPAIEELIQVAKKLGMSLDALLLDSQPERVTTTTSPNSAGERKIAIRSYDGNTFSSYNNFIISRIYLGGKKNPKFSLAGVTGSGIFGDRMTPLGSYATNEDAQKELSEILTAMQNGEEMYQLKYFTKWKNDK